MEFWPCCIKLNNDGNCDININYHGNITQQPIKLRFPWKLPLMAKLPSMVGFMQRGQGLKGKSREMVQIYYQEKQMK